VSRTDDAVAVFEAERPRLLGLAYRVTGTLADAEDVVQDAWLRLDRTGLDTLERPAAWLTTVVGRLALDRLRAGQRVRETYVGPWLPEPVVRPAAHAVHAADAGDPADVAELHDSLTLGFLVVLERLGPVERTVFLLADVFGVPFDEIATTVDRSPAACRQIASRARRRVREERPRFATSTEEAAGVATAFFAAFTDGDLDGLLATLDDDAVLTSDGGAETRAARRPVVGADRVGRLLANLWSRRPEGVSTEPVLVNGDPGIAAKFGDFVGALLAVEVAEGRVQRVRIVMNPAKLARAGEVIHLV
jgi:RNA polymerase sigma-70 factor, ECF subfamily